MSQLRRDVRNRSFTLRIWSPLYKYVKKGNSNVKQSFDHIVTVRKSVSGVKLGVMNCQSIGGKLDFVLLILRNINCGVDGNVVVFHLYWINMHNQNVFML